MKTDKIFKIFFWLQVIIVITIIIFAILFLIYIFKNPDSIGEFVGKIVNGFNKTLN